jgi:hypothetical protein
MLSNTLNSNLNILRSDARFRDLNYNSNGMGVVYWTS